MPSPARTNHHQSLISMAPGVHAFLGADAHLRTRNMFFPHGTEPDAKVLETASCKQVKVSDLGGNTLGTIIVPRDEKQILLREVKTHLVAVRSGAEISLAGQGVVLPTEIVEKVRSSFSGRCDEEASEPITVATTSVGPHGHGQEAEGETKSVKKAMSSSSTSTFLKDEDEERCIVWDGRFPIPTGETADEEKACEIQVVFDGRAQQALEFARAHLQRISAGDMRFLRKKHIDEFNYPVDEEDVVADSEAEDDTWDDYDLPDDADNNI